MCVLASVFVESLSVGEYEYVRSCGSLFQCLCESVSVCERLSVSACLSLCVCISLPECVRVCVCVCILGESVTKGSGITVDRGHLTLDKQIRVHLLAQKLTKLVGAIT